MKSARIGAHFCQSKKKTILVHLISRHQTATPSLMSKMKKMDDVISMDDDDEEMILSDTQQQQQQQRQPLVALTTPSLRPSSSSMSASINTTGGGAVAAACVTSISSKSSSSPRTDSGSTTRSMQQPLWWRQLVAAAAAASVQARAMIPRQLLQSLQPPLASVTQQLPPATAAGVQALLVRQFIVSFLWALVGWYGPRYWIYHETEMAHKEPPYQKLNSGEVILDFTLSYPLVYPPTIPCKCIQPSACFPNLNQTLLSDY